MADKKTPETTEELDPKVQGFLEEDAKKKEELKAQKELDFKAPYDEKAILEVRHLRKCFPIQKSLLGKVQKASI